MFQVRVLVDATSAASIDAGQVYLDFDPQFFEVVSVEAGSRMEIRLQSSVDNNRGTLGFAAGTLEYPVGYRFTLCTVTFRALESTSDRGSLIEFADLKKPRQTKVVSRGLNVTGDLESLRVIVR